MLALSQRTEIDCGSGRGNFTIEGAREHPDTTFIGVDINLNQHKVSEAARRKSQLPNAHFVHAEVKDYLVRYVPDATISAFHVYFPTPHMSSIIRENALAQDLRGWLISPGFIEELRRAALPGATMRFATDHRPYANEVSQLVARMNLTVLPWTEPLAHKSVGDLVGTGCERAMRRRGRDIHFLQCALR